jgi:hypothetical protein
LSLPVAPGKASDALQYTHLQIGVEQRDLSYYRGCGI